VIVVMMENRSYDHFLCWLPRADGRQRGLAYPDASGRLVPTHPLAPDFTGCGFLDPDHSYEGGRVEFDDGRCDAISRSSGRPRRSGRRATATSARSSARRSPTASISTRA
jgi:phospholipase C